MTRSSMKLLDQAGELIMSLSICHAKLGIESGRGGILRPREGNSN